MRIQQNIVAQNARRQNAVSNGKTAKSIERLSSGLKINSAADDAAGLAISEKMRAQTRGMSRASANIQEGINLLDIADGGLQKCHDIIGRMRELAVQSASDTNSDVIDREALDMEYQQLKDELDAIVDSTTYNNIKLLDGSIAELRVAGISMSLKGVTDAGKQVAVNTVVRGVNTVTTYAMAGTIGLVAAPSTSPTTPTMPTPTPANITDISGGGTVTDNGDKFLAVFALGDDASNAAAQGRDNSAIEAVKAGGDLTVTNNGYTGYVISDSNYDNLTVTTNEGFVHSNADNTTIGTITHTGQVKIDAGAGATVTIGKNTGGEVAIGNVDSFTITNNLIHDGIESQAADYTFTRTYYYVYNGEITRTQEVSCSGIDDRISSANNEQYSAPLTDFTSYYEEVVYGSSNGSKRVDGTTYYNNVQYSYYIDSDFKPTSPSTFNGEDHAGDAYAYIYRTYWDEQEVGTISSGAETNTIHFNEGVITLTNAASNTVTNITTNEGTLNTVNKAVTVGINKAILNADCETFVVQDNTYTTSTLGNTVYGVINVEASDQTTIVNNHGTIYVESPDVDVTNNDRLLYSYADDQNTTFDLTGTNGSAGDIYVWAEKTNIATNRGQIYAGNTVETLTVTTNSNYSYYSSTNTVGSGGDGTYTNYNYTNTGITSDAEHTIITTNASDASALIRQGDVLVGSNEGRIDIQSGVEVLNIDNKAGGTVILRDGANITGWITNSGGISSAGNIEIYGKTVPDPPVIASSSGNIKITNGAKLEVTDNTGTMEISGGRVGGTASTVTIDNNSGEIKNGGNLELTTSNSGIINNYGTVTGSGLSSSSTIRHFATNVDTSGIYFPTSVNLSSQSKEELNAELANHESTLTFTANGQTFSVTATWQLLDDIVPECQCDPEVDTCDEFKTITFDAFELVFDFTSAKLVTDNGLVPANFDGGYVVFSESSSMLADGLRYELGELVDVTGESGKVGRKLTFTASADALFSKTYEKNEGLTIQSGANQGDKTIIHIDKLSTDELGEDGCVGCNCGSLRSTTLLSQESSEKSLNMCTAAAKQISQNRARIGAMRNRLEYKLSSLEISNENLTSAESRIRDADMAKEMTDLTRQQVLNQASTAMLAQANSLPQGVLQLLG